MGVVNWPDSHASVRRSRRVRSRGAEEPLEHYEPDAEPVRENFWAAYGRRVGLCASSVGVSTLILLTNAGTFSIHGFRGLVYLALFFIFGVVPAILPFIWYQDHRRLRRASRYPRDDEGEPRLVGRFRSKGGPESGSAAHG